VNCLKLLHDESVKCLGVFGPDLNVWNDSAQAPDPIDDLVEWQTLVQGALQNFGPFLDAVECWSEPDLTQNQNGYMNGPQHYFDMLQILYDETKMYAEEHNKTIDVVAGSVVTIYSIETVPGHDVPGAGTLFIQNITDLGSDGFCDAYSMHIYKADATPPVHANPHQFLRGHTAREAYDYIKNVTDANTTNPKQLWVSEMGTHDKTDDGQAEQMQTWFYELTGVSCPMIFWYNYVDPIENMHGILRNGTLEERPAYHVYSSVRAVTVVVTVLNQLNPSLDATLTLTVTGPNNYYYFDFQSVNVTADTVGECWFSWNIPDVAGTYVVEASLVPPQLTAYDAVWLGVN